MILHENLLLMFGMFISNIKMLINYFILRKKYDLQSKLNIIIMFFSQFTLDLNFGIICERFSNI